MKILHVRVQSPERWVSRGGSWFRTRLSGIRIKPEHLTPGSQYKENSPLQESKVLHNGWTLGVVRRYNNPATATWLVNHRAMGSCPWFWLPSPPAPSLALCQAQVDWEVGYGLKLLGFEFSFFIQGQGTKLRVSVSLSVQWEY